MIENIFKSDRIIDGNRRTVIVDETGKIVNKNPSKEELKGLKVEYYVRKSPNRIPPDTKCYRCGKKAVLKEYDSNRIETGNLICNPCYQLKYRYGTYEKPEPIQKYTKEQIIGITKQIYEEKGRTPTADDFRNDPVGLGIVLKYFGSLNNAIREAGLHVNRFSNLTDEELLEFLVQFYIENGRVPTTADFKNNPKYPNYQVYINHFGSWHKSLKLVGLDVDSIVRKGIIETSRQKARLSEIFVLEHFIDEGATDLSGESCNSHVDGICPKGQIYDVKSSGLNFNGRHWSFYLDKGEEVGFYYLLAFNEDYSELIHVWRIPWNFTDKNFINIGLNSNYEYNLENMKGFDITKKFKDVFNSLYTESKIPSKTTLQIDVTIT